MPGLALAAAALAWAEPARGGAGAAAGSQVGPRGIPPLLSLLLSLQKSAWAHASTS